MWPLSSRGGEGKGLSGQATKKNNFFCGFNYGANKTFFGDQKLPSTENFIIKKNK